MFASVSPSAFSFLFIVVLFALAFTAANNDINVLSQTELDHCVTEPTKLVLHNVTLLDAGIYMCHAINNIGDVNSSAVLTVLPATANSGQFFSVTQCIPSSLTYGGHTTHVNIVMAPSPYGRGIKR